MILDQTCQNHKVKRILATNWNVALRSSNNGKNSLVCFEGNPCHAVNFRQPWVCFQNHEKFICEKFNSGNYVCEFLVAQTASKVLWSLPANTDNPLKIIEIASGASLEALGNRWGHEDRLHLKVPNFMTFSACKTQLPLLIFQVPLFGISIC